MSKRGALALVTLAHGLGSLSILAVAPLSPFLLDGLSLSRVQVGLFLPAAYLLAPVHLGGAVGRLG